MHLIIPLWFVHVPKEQWKNPISLGMWLLRKQLATHPDDELEGFVTVNKPNIYKAKSILGFEFIDHEN